MTARNLQNLNNDLENTGFVSIEGDRFRFEPISGKSPLRHELPWQIQNWELAAKGQDLYQESFAAKLNAELFIQNFEDLLKNASQPSVRWLCRKTRRAASGSSSNSSTAIWMRIKVA